MNGPGILQLLRLMYVKKCMGLYRNLTQENTNQICRAKGSSIAWRSRVDRCRAMESRVDFIYKLYLYIGLVSCSCLATKIVAAVNGTLLCLFMAAASAGVYSHRLSKNVYCR